MFSKNVYKNGSVLNQAVPSLVTIWTRFGSKYAHVHAERYICDNNGKDIWKYKFQTLEAWKLHVKNHGNYHDKYCTCKSSELYEYVIFHTRWHSCIYLHNCILAELIPEQFQTARIVKETVKHRRDSLFFVREDLQTEELILDGITGRNIQDKIRKDLQPFYERYYNLFKQIQAEVIVQLCHENISKLETLAYEIFRKRIDL